MYGGSENVIKVPESVKEKRAVKDQSEKQAVVAHAKEVLAQDKRNKKVNSIILAKDREILQQIFSSEDTAEMKSFSSSFPAMFHTLNFYNKN